MARERGIKVGFLRLVTVWPFPEEMIRTLARRVKGFVTVEINMGQIVREVERCAGGTPSFSVGHAGGAIIDPKTVLTLIDKEFLS